MTAGKQRCCTTCGEPIPAKRLEVKPNATQCVPCLEASGDVARIRRYDQYDSRNVLVAETYFTDDPRLERQLQRLVNLHRAPIVVDSLTGTSDFDPEALDEAVALDTVIGEEALAHEREIQDFQEDNVLPQAA